MPIKIISFSHFRNLSNDKLSLHPKLNFIVGMNGSGKTSLLEAIYYLSTGRSFRSRIIENIIKRHSDISEFILFGQLTNKQQVYSVGIKKSTTQNTQIKINKESIKSASPLAKLSPTILIDPLSFELLNGAPTQRRQFLDWGVFHVEHSFSSNWNNYINCLKQRNSLLRNAKIDELSLKIWEDKLIELGELVHQQRASYFDSFNQNLIPYLDEFALDNNIRIQYYRGWDKAKNLSDVMYESRAKDIDRKYTQSGPHRADIKVNLFGQAAKETMSRGQQKLLITALYLAQIQTLLKVQEKHTVVLIDDIAAELDERNVARIYTSLQKLDSQIIATTLSESLIKTLSEIEKDYKMFHVEHGCFKELE